MKMTFRWQGEQDKVPLKFIRQIPGMTGVVSAVYDVKPGEIWSHESIEAVKRQANENGLAFEVVESVPVPEAIKLGSADRDRCLDNFCENVRRCAAHGVKVICYNFMPVFDWTRTQLDKLAEDGSTSLVMYQEQLKHIDPSSDEISLPGWDASYSKEEMAALLKEYRALGEEGLWKNFEIFLKRVIPIADEVGIKMAIHPDDPPYSIFGIPRIITCEENLDRMCGIVDSEANGITFCTGSLGASDKNDIPRLAAKYAKMNRIHFVHMRNILLLPDGSFEECGHKSDKGSLDMYEITKALVENGFDGYVRPDHGRMIWDENGRPGYGLFDRALGAAYINGLFEAVEKGGR